MDIAQTLVVSTLGALLVEIMHLTLDVFKQKSSRKIETIKKVQQFVDECRDLTGLYGLFARAESHLKMDEHGNPIKDQNGILVYESVEMEPEKRDEKTFESQKTTLRNEIDRRRVALTVKMDAIQDLVINLEPTGDLSKKFTQLYILMDLMDIEVDAKTLQAFVERRSESIDLRREIDSNLENLYPKGPLAFLLD